MLSGYSVRFGGLGGLGGVWELTIQYRGSIWGHKAAGGGSGDSVRFGGLGRGGCTGFHRWLRRQWFGFIPKLYIMHYTLYTTIYSMHRYIMHY